MGSLDRGFVMHSSGVPRRRESHEESLDEEEVSPQDPTKFFLYEQYTNAQAYEDHKATEHFKKHVFGYAIEYLEAREVATYETTVVDSNFQ